MRIECESCGQLVDATVTPSASGVELTCNACGHLAILGASPAAGPPAGSRALKRQPALRKPEKPSPNSKKPPPPLSIPSGEGAQRCPKCGWRQDNPVSCHKCGLSLSLARTGRRPWETVDPGKADLQKELERRWGVLKGNDFLEQSEHDAFIKYASSVNLLQQAASLYRFYAQDHPNTPGGELASVNLMRLVEMMNAMFILDSGRSLDSETIKHKVKRIKRAVYVVLLLLGILVLGYMLSQDNIMSMLDRSF